MVDQILAGINEILTNDLDKILGLILLSFIAYMIYREKNDSKESDALTTIITTLAKPTSDLIKAQAKQVEALAIQTDAINRLAFAIENDGINARAAMAQNTATIMTALAAITSTVNGLQIEISNELVEQTGAIMTVLKPLDELSEIKRILTALQGDTSAIRDELERHGQTLTAFNSRVDNVEAKAVNAAKLVDKIIEEKTNEKPNHIDIVSGASIPSDDGTRRKPTSDESTRSASG